MKFHSSTDAIKETKENYFIHFKTHWKNLEHKKTFADFKLKRYIAEQTI